MRISVVAVAVAEPLCFPAVGMVADHGGVNRSEVSHLGHAKHLQSSLAKGD